jgi:hypothetical protein
MLKEQMDAFARAMYYCSPACLYAAVIDNNE